MFFPADIIPTVRAKPVALVLNADNHTKPGTYGIAMYVDAVGKGYYFDSHGLHPIILQHKNRLGKLCTFFVLFLHLISSGVSMNELCSLFSSDTE